MTMVEEDEKVEEEGEKLIDTLSATSISIGYLSVCVLGSTVARTTT